MAKSSAASRRERAAATRRAILEAAQHLFSQRGYAGTTIEAIAERAGVAVQTVYYVFHNKSSLVREMFMSMGGRPDEPTDTANRSWVKEAETVEDGRASLALSTDNGAEIYRRLAPIYPTILAAISTEPEIAEIWDQMMKAKQGSIVAQMQHLERLGELREGLDAQTAADVSFSVHSIEMYRLLTEVCGWEHDRYKQWALETLSQLLLRPEPGEPA